MVNPVFFVQHFLLLALIFPVCAMASECFPGPDKEKDQYLVVYGNYFYDQARHESLSDMQQDIPVWVNDYKRGWFSRSKPEAIKITQLGVVPSPGIRFNGLLAKLNPGTLKSMDSHEKYSCRIKVDPSKFQPMTHKKVDNDGEYWVYQTKKKQKLSPAANFPIYQSQVDQFLTGCIEQAERFKLSEFADECMKTTHNWSPSWSNDRMRPIFGKSVQGRREQVNKLLIKYQSEYFGAIKAE